MAKMNTNKTVTTIRLNDTIREKLKEQAQKIGMDVSNYIAYLVMFKEEKEKEELKSKQILKDFLKSVLSAEDVER